MADLSQYLDMPDAMLQQYFPSADIAALKEQIRKGLSGQTSEANAKPVTQTIKTDPITGEQTMTISGKPEDLSANNPLTPTVSAPAVPTQTAPQIQPPARPIVPVNPVEAYNRYTQQMESGANPNIGYHDPNKSTAYGAYGITQPQYREIQRANPQFAGRDITTLTPEEQTLANTTSRDVYARQLQAKGVEPTEANLRLAHFLGAGGARQFLNNGTISPEAAAANGGEDRVRQIAMQRLNGPINPNQPRSPMIAGTPSSDVALTPTEQAVARMSQTPGYNPNAAPAPEQVPTWQKAITAAGNNPAKLFAISDSQDPNIPQEVKDIARNKGVEAAIALRDRTAAGTIIQAGLPGDDMAASKKLVDEMRRKNEGSYVRALLLQGAGFSAAADREFQKLEGGKFRQASINGQQYLIKEAPDGSILQAWDSKARPQDDNQIVRLNTEIAPKGSDIGGEIYKDPSGVVKGTFYLERRPGQGAVFKEFGTNRPATKEESDVLNKIGVGGTLANKRDALIQEWNIKLQGKTQEEKYAITREYNAKLVGAGFPPVQPYEFELAAPQISTGRPAPAPAQAAPAPAAPAPAQAAPAPAQAAPAVQNVSAPVPAGRGPVPPNAPLPMSNVVFQRRPTMNDLIAQETIAKEQSKVVGEDIGKVKANLGKIKENADYLTTKIDELITDPGFKYNVGVADIGGVPIPFGSTIAGLIPGTQATDFKARFDEIKGQQFLQGIESLKNTGAISNAEGQAAQKAVSRMSLSQSEAEFKKAADDFQNIIKRGVDRNLRKAGEEPLYGTPLASEQKRQNDQSNEVDVNNPLLKKKK
jgi:hypothetical protein